MSLFPGGGFAASIAPKASCSSWLRCKSSAVKYLASHCAFAFFSRRIVSSQRLEAWSSMVFAQDAFFSSVCVTFSSSGG